MFDCRHRDNVETRQVTWWQPLAADQAVAIVGGGISGLACAQVCNLFSSAPLLLLVDPTCPSLLLSSAKNSADAVTVALGFVQ
jgi:hypothetical protein